MHQAGAREEDLGGSCSFLSGFRVGATVMAARSKNEVTNQGTKRHAANEACVSAFLEVVALPQALAQVKREVAECVTAATRGARGGSNEWGDQQEQRDEAQGR